VVMDDQELTVPQDPKENKDSQEPKDELVIVEHEENQEQSDHKETLDVMANVVSQDLMERTEKLVPQDNKDHKV